MPPLRATLLFRCGANGVRLKTQVPAAPTLGPTAQEWGPPSGVPGGGAAGAAAPPDSIAEADARRRAYLAEAADDVAAAAEAAEAGRSRMALKSQVTADPDRDGGYLSTPIARRMWGVVGANFCGQLTSYWTGEYHEGEPQVHTEIVAYVLTSMECATPQGEEDGETTVVPPQQHLYRTDGSGRGVDGEAEEAGRDWSFIMAVPAKSAHLRNLRAGSLCSMTLGSANPQILNFFEQIKARPWRSSLSGRTTEITRPEVASALWQANFAQHKLLWMEAKWRRKQGQQGGDQPGGCGSAQPPQGRRARASAKTDEEEDDEEDEMAGRISPTDFVLFRFTPESAFLVRPDGGLDKVPFIDFPPPDPLGSVVQPWLTRINFRRDLIIKGARASYSINLLNCFAFHLDRHGLYLMGWAARPPDAPPTDDPTVLWEEFFLEWGPSIEITQPHVLKHWWQELVSNAQLESDGEKGDVHPELLD